MQEVCVFATGNAFEAEQARELLEANNIPCFLKNSFAGALAGFGAQTNPFSCRHGQIELIVRDVDLQTAQSVLEPFWGAQES